MVLLVTQRNMCPGYLLMCKTKRNTIESSGFWMNTGSF